jgi:hypothetical protein
MKNKLWTLLIPSILLGFILLLQNGCSDENTDPYPGISLATLTTDSVTWTTSFSAYIKTTMASKGGGKVSERGVCWSKTNQLPRTMDNKLKGDTTLGTYTTEIPDLDQYTTYYVRAYAINQKGVAYGNALKFKTQSLPPGNLQVRVMYLGSRCGGANVYIYESAADRTTDVTRTNYYAASIADVPNGAVFFDLPITKFYIFCKWVNGSQTCTGTGEMTTQSSQTTTIEVTVKP